MNVRFTRLRFARPWRRATPVVVAALAVMLAACAGSSDPQADRLGKFLVAPGKYHFYDCDRLATAAIPYVKREKELREAMANAEASPAGGLIATMGYSTEYGQVRGNIDEMRSEAIAKKCDPMPAVLLPSRLAPLH